MTLSDNKIAGTLLIVGGVQFILALIVAEAIYPLYNIADNYISDLGVWNQPSALVFNPSIIFFGATSLTASIYIKRYFQLKKTFYLYALAGIGAIGVGLFPEDFFIVGGIAILHNLSALFAFMFGGFTAIATYKITKAPFRYISAVLGVFALTAFAVFLATRDFSALGIGAGALERLVAYPTVLWLICFGGYLLGSQTEK
jgi:hypothetical membrane protein